MTDFSDISLITQVTVFHNTKAFNRLVVKYQSPIRRFFMNQTLGDKQLSDDLAQETFIKAYTNLQKFKGLANFSTWLYRIAYNVHYDYVRSHRMSEDVDNSPAAARLNANNGDSMLRMDIYDALSKISERERTCITLQLIDGYSIDKISEITGMAQGTVKSHLSRGKEKLATFLRRNGYDGK